MATFVAFGGVLVCTDQVSAAYSVDEAETTLIVDGRKVRVPVDIARVRLALLHYGVHGIYDLPEDEEAPSDARE